ncbi:Sua5/YciO/YrdC/YwlC family protein [Streptomyces sp. NPDC038707]|uniref:Sua5/YciO/YrdC/YwlC family protein n=1 Tax=Streptomyces sp. NPDC038707 TaxID=3154329 RepID=UPI00340AEE10
MTRVVTATRPRTVNEAKARPADQPVALWAHHPDTLDTLARHWDLDPGSSRTARRLLAEEHLTVLLPLRQDTGRPAWLSPAVKDGWMLLFGARWQPLRPLLDEHPVLYASSANRTGRPPATTSAEALAMFPETVAVLEELAPGQAVPPADGPRRATTTVRVHPDGRLELHRHGAQDRPYATADDYLSHLTSRYTDPR